MFTLAQISDPHLGAQTSLFRRNFDAVVEHLIAEPPDLIIATGDVSLDGADSEADMAFAAQSLARLPRPHMPCRAIMMSAIIPNAPRGSPATQNAWPGSAAISARIGG